MFVTQSQKKTLPKHYGWLKNEIHKTYQKIETSGFPCVFGVQGHKRGVHCYSALNYPFDPEELATDIDLYLCELAKMKKKDRGISGLIVFFEPLGDMDIHAKQFMVWELLNIMKKKFGFASDNVDNNPLNDDYSFKFKNELWFINFSSNSYNSRKSRNLNSFITLAMQTLSKSDEYFNSDMNVKTKAQKTVRNLTEKYDGCPVHSGLGPLIDSGEFSPAKLSYFIGDTNEESSYEPWKFTKFKPKKVIIDEKIFFETAKKIEFESFKMIAFDMEIKIINSEIINDDLSKRNILVTNNSEFLDKFNGKIRFGTFDIKNKEVFECYIIKHFNDLLALHS